MVGRLLLVAALLAGCRATDAFVCASDDQCRHNGALGHCESVGYCSFTDGTCPSKSRFDDNSDPTYAGKCVDSMIDAAIDSTPSFNPAICPAAYVQINATRTTTRYRLVTQLDTFLHQATSCNDDLVGATHLAVPQNAQELNELSAWIDPMTSIQFYWLGVVQDPNAIAPDARWILLDDTNVPLTLWKPNEPNDKDDVENGEEQFAFLDKTATVRRMNDTPGGADTHGAICECDGQPIGPSATVFVGQ